MGMPPFIRAGTLTRKEIKFSVDWNTNGFTLNNIQRVYCFLFFIYVSKNEPKTAVLCAYNIFQTNETVFAIIFI